MILGPINIYFLSRMQQKGSFRLNFNFLSGVYVSRNFIISLTPFSVVRFVIIVSETNDFNQNRQEWGSFLILALKIQAYLSVSRGQIS